MVTSTQADQVSHANQPRYRHLFEHAPICICVIDLSQQSAIIREVNRRMAWVFGYTPAELTGRPATCLIPDASVPDALSIVAQVQQGRTVTAELTHQRRDGTLFPARVTAAPDPRDPGGMLVTIEDITAEKQRRSEADAIDAERLRIAHEIHDGVAQSLAGLRFKSASLASLEGKVPPGMIAALDEMQDVLTTAIVDLRRAIFALRPVELEEKGFFPALAQLVGDFGNQNHLAVQLEVVGVPDALPAVYEWPLFRVIQECLNNVAQHARASSVVVCIAVDDSGGVVMSLSDDGCGFHVNQLGPPTSGTRHFGLRHMRERIMDIGGTLQICSEPSQGTEVLITLPSTTKEGNHGAA